MIMESEEKCGWEMDWYLKKVYCFSPRNTIKLYLVEKMIYTTEQLIEKYSNYHNPMDKIKRLNQQGKIIRLIKGVYVDNRNENPFSLAACVYSPSYISFESALSYHGLIPERVYRITCATSARGKNKTYKTPFGIYSFHDVPLKAFPLGVDRIADETGFFYRASPEKALCDRLSIKPPVFSLKQLRQLLFDDRRIERTDFESLNKKDLGILTGYYDKRNLKFLRKRVIGGVKNE